MFPDTRLTFQVRKVVGGGGWPVGLQLRQNKYSADFQGCFEDVRAFLILILCSLSIPLGL